jgi:hypothetical protein
MDLGAILILLALLLGVGVFLAAPLLRNGHPRSMEESQEVSELLAERDRIINSLQELDFDYNLGKVPEEAYPEQRADLLQRGAAVLQKLDALAPQAASRKTAVSAATARIERAAAAADGSGKVLADDRIESLLAARRAARRSKSAGFCPRCGKPVLTSDRFCPNCGKSL